MGKKKFKPLKVISFDEETVPKNIAEQILANETVATPDLNLDVSSGKKKKKKKKLNENDKSTEETKINEPELMQVESNDQGVSKKVKKKNQQTKETDTNCDDPKPKKKRKQVEEPETQEEVDPNNPTEPKKKESIRERKRKKYAKLLEEKKLKTELALQQKSLEYLSKWKHCRDEWKFEKLRQIWLQHNMYDSAKMPQEFWDILVEYLSNAKGKAKDAILKDAVKIIEEESTDDGEDNNRIKRARDIVQNLQE